jgi:predicted secreted Zn-dependent protease
MLFSQTSEETIPWSASRKLTWQDFKAPPQQQGDAAALTATHLGFSYRVVNGKITYSIDCRFEKNRSWGLVQTDWILQHEQGHFDIAEIFARKLHQAVATYVFNKNSFQKELDSLYKQIVNEKEKFQQAYDLETDFSRNKNKQAEWLKKIEAELVRYKKWAAY